MANTIGTAYINIAPNMTGIQGKIAGGLRGAGSQFADRFGAEISGRSAVIVGAIAGIASAGVNKAMSLVTSSIGNAIRRVDTLNSAAKTFQYMGFSAADSSKAVKDVTTSIQGLPTPLDGAIRGMSALAATYGNIGLGQKVFTALNDGILGMGGSADMVTGAVQQLSQLPLDGPLDAQTWNSLRNSGLTPVMVAMGKDMGKSVSQLKADFGSGKLTVQDFTNELLKMDTQGGGGLTNLHTIAMTATGGIGTGFANMQTAITRGLAAIIQSIGAKNISNAISEIGKVFETILKVVAKDIPIAIGYIKSMVDFVDRHRGVFETLAVVVGAAATAMLGLMIAAKVTAAIGAVSKAIETAKAVMMIYTTSTAAGATSMEAFNVALDANPIGIIIVALTALVAGLVFFFTQTALGKRIFADFVNFLQGVWSSIMSGVQAIGNFFAGVWNYAVTAVQTVTGAINTAYNAVSNFVSAGINVLSNAVQAVINWIVAWRAWFINIGIVIGTILLPKVIQLGIEAVKSAIRWVASMGQMAASTATSAAQSVVAFIKMSASAVVEAAKSAAAWVVSAAQSTAAFIAGIPKMVAQFVVASAASVANAAIATAAWVAGAARQIAAWVVAFATYVAGVAASAAATLIAGAQMALAWLMALGPIGLIIAAVAGATALIIANWQSVSTFVAGVWDWIKGAVAAFIGWISANWPLLLAIITGPIGLAVLFIVNHWQQIKDGAANMINGLVGFFTGLPGRIMGAIGNMGSLLYNSGRDLINGLINGAGSLLSKIGEMFLNVIPGWIKEPFKKALGIHSPSTVFAGYAHDTVDGYTNTIADRQASVTSALTGMANAAMDGMTASPFAAQFATSVNSPAPSASATVAGGPGIAGDPNAPAVVQNNNIYNQVDLNSVTRELAWQIRR